MFSLSTNSLPKKFSDFCIYNNQLHDYNTRSKNLFRLPKTRTKLRQFSIRYLGPTIYNSLSDKVKNSTSYVTFSKNIRLYFIGQYEETSAQ